MNSEDESELPSAMANKFDFLLKKREQLFAELQSVYDISSKVAPGTVSSFITRCSDLSRLRDKFEAVQDRVLELNMEVDVRHQKEVENVTTSFNELYYQIRVIERDVLNHMNPVAPPRTEISLPNIEIPTWDGDIENFHNFWSMFNTIVHDGRYSNVIKMTYLKRSLRGSPLKLIQNLSNDNYTTAYNLINNRYGNLRNLAAFYVDKMLNFSPLAGSSLKELQSFLDVFSTTCTAYNNLNLEDHKDFILFQNAFRALPIQIRTLFERSLEPGNDLPRFQDLVDFVEQQCKIEEISSNYSKPPVASCKPSLPINRSRNPQSLVITPAAKENFENVMPSSSRSTTPPAGESAASSCAFCGQSHSLYVCELYNNASVDDRYEWSRKNRRCFRCLGSHHRLRCASKGKCIHCQSVSHHSSLHRTDLENIENNIKNDLSRPSGSRSTS